MRVDMKETKVGHFALKIGIHKEWTTMDTVLLMEKVDDVTTWEKIKKMELSMGNLTKTAMIHYFALP